MSDSMTPDVREVIRRRIEVRESHGHERLLLNHDALLALLDAADERERLLTVAATLGRVNGEYAMEIHRCREALGVDEDTDPHHAAQALAAAVKRVRALHVADGEGCCRCCDYMTPHPCPTLRALDGTDGPQ